jgi:hypothetical protein
MQAFLKTFLALFGKAGLKALINTLASSSMFQDFVHGLIMKRLEGLKAKYPSLYTTLDGYATAVSKIPEVTTDDNPNNVDQIAELFTLLGDVERSAKALTVKARELKIQL